MGLKCFCFRRLSSDSFRLHVVLAMSYCRLFISVFPSRIRQVTMNDGCKYGVLRRYSQFDQLRERVAPVLRTVTPPFPPKNSIRSATVGLRPGELEERR